MTAAVLLASYGIPVTVVDKNATTANDPKAMSLDDESLRPYQRAGIADAVLGVIVPGTGTRYFDADDRLIFHGGASIPYRHGHPFKNPFAQPDLERVLRNSLESIRLWIFSSPPSSRTSSRVTMESSRRCSSTVLRRAEATSTCSRQMVAAHL